MGSRLSGLGSALWNSKRRQFLGRDGAGWGKLGVFYFFFYLGLAGFFCAMLAIFMALTPRDHPRYTLDDSRMRTRSNPLSPGLGFRPQPEVDKNLIVFYKNGKRKVNNLYAKNLDQYLQVFYAQKDASERRENDDNDDGDNNDRPRKTYRKFNIQNPGECTNATQYGFSRERPCVLIKMNKIVDFEPKPGAPPHDRGAYHAACKPKPNAVAIHCYGEYPADVDNIGPIDYMSENGFDPKCGYLETSRFPYEGKDNRKDYYQAPYIWAQFTKPKPNVLINVLCRVFGQNIDFDKKAGRALTRFQIYFNDLPAPTDEAEEL